MGFSKNSALLRTPPFAQVQHALPCHYFLSHSRFPLCLLCSFLRRPCARTGAAPFCPFGNTDGSAPAVILNTKFFRHMFLFVLKWQ